MAGRPLRRARLAAEEYQRALALRDGEEPMQLGERTYSALVAPPPVRHIKVPRAPQRRPPAPLAEAAPSPIPARRARAAPPEPPPMSEADAAVFAEARTLALRTSLDFLKQDLTAEYDPAIRAKLLLKQLEVAQSILSLGGRVDPAGLRGQGGDEKEISDMLAAIKGAPKP